MYFTMTKMEYYRCCVRPYHQESTVSHQDTESLELSDTVICVQAASSEIHNVKIACDKATKTRSNLLWVCIIHNIIILSSSLCRKFNVFNYTKSAQTEQKHTSMTFVWFPDHVFWCIMFFCVLWLDESNSRYILKTRTRNICCSSSAIFSQTFSFIFSFL